MLFRSEKAEYEYYKQRVVPPEVLLDRLEKRVNELEDRIAVLEEEKKTKTSMSIVSQEDLERFWRGEMTKQELLEIKKKVDSIGHDRVGHDYVLDDEHTPSLDKCGEQYIPN